ASDYAKRPHNTGYADDGTSAESARNMQGLAHYRSERISTMLPRPALGRVGSAASSQPGCFLRGGREHRHRRSERCWVAHFDDYPSLRLANEVALVGQI